MARDACRIHIEGRVQGVGFRPFVLRQALQWGVAGWVRNVGGGVEIHAEAEPAPLAAFIDALRTGAPPLAQPLPPRIEPAAPERLTAFVIRPSAGQGPGFGVLPPDYFVCADCLADLRQAGNRRYRYPFTHCTQCGPRYTLIDRLPYDRPNTAMAAFPLCAECRAEYDDPTDRRYHAQPLACPACGPRLVYRAPDGASVSGHEAALAACVAGLRAGLIVAVKGVGGYHLMCDAGSDAAVQRLRARKHRPDKPLAVMLPECLLADADALAAVAAPDAQERALLCSPLRPIVLVPAAGQGLSAGIAPGLGEVGLMLPYSPLHHLLCDDFGGPLVATSANLSGEPVLTEAHAVEQRLGAVADAFLHHDRPIRRPADDSVFRRVAGRLRPLRLGRGLAPIELRLPCPVAQPVLALGADLKNTLALAVGDRVLVSPHLGDLGAPRSLEVFAQVADDLCRLQGVTPAQLVCDAHPDYYSSRWAAARGVPVQRVFHHHAHAAAVYAEQVEAQALLVFTWDGLGYGADGTVWGGEALLGQPGHWRRVASLRPFRLLGGDRASREPWRCALSVCLEAGLDWPAAPPQAELAQAVWARRINSPACSSVGRLFDAAAALIGITQTQSYEGQAAMRLEALAQGAGEVEAVPLPLGQDAAGYMCADWSPLLPVLLAAERSPAERAAVFHRSLAGLLRDQAVAIRASEGIGRVGLAGGVFQNRVLTGQVLQLLQAAGFEVVIPAQLPVNDAAISVGQIIEAQAAAARTGGDGRHRV